MKESIEMFVFRIMKLVGKVFVALGFICCFVVLYVIPVYVIMKGACSQWFRSLCWVWAVFAYGATLVALVMTYYMYLKDKYDKKN